jgi:hypothetical protein
MAIVIRLGVAHKASPYYRYRDGMGIATVKWQLRAKADTYVGCSWNLVEEHHFSRDISIIP